MTRCSFGVEDCGSEEPAGLGLVWLKIHSVETKYITIKHVIHV